MISNLTATVASGGIAGIIWGRTEMPVTNITLKKISITAPGNLDLYNVKGLTVSDPRLTISGGAKTFSIYNAQLVLTNSATGAAPVSMDGLAGTSSLALYNARIAMSDTNALGANPILLNASTLSNSTSLVLPASTVVNFGLGTNDAIISAAGNLTLNSSLNITNAGGFGAGAYTLFTYTGTLSGVPTLNSTPAGYNYSINTNVSGQVMLSVQSTNASRPSFTTVASSDTGLILGGTGGPPSTSYIVATSTNLLLTNWTRISTNLFDGNGNFRFTNAISPSVPQSFFRIQLP